MKSVFLKIKTLFLLAIFGTGVSLKVGANPEIHNIQARIRSKVHEHKYEIDTIKNSNQLNNLLAKLKSEILLILADDSILSTRELTLKSALIALNPSDKLSIAAHIKTILVNLDADIANIIINAIPQVYKTILCI